MVGQTRAVLQKYAQNGGAFREVVMEGCAHACILEQPDKVADEMESFLLA
jgi:pimeloyl-ACP methyl ester carboxylesterase